VKQKTAVGSFVITFFRPGW